MAKQPQQRAARTTDPASSPVVWFAVLERARLTNDDALSRHARAMLAQAGVYVLYDQGQGPGPLFTQDDLRAIAAQLANLLRG